MFAKSAIVSLAVVAAASPVFSAPLPVAEVDVRDLEARLSLPTGALGSLIKSLGKGVLTGGAVSGLLGLLGEGDSSSSSTSSRRGLDLEARAGLGALLGKLVGAGEETLESVLKKAVIGGVASGVGAEAVNSATGQSSRRGVPAAVVDDAAKAAEKGISSVIGDGLASGVGSALGGLGIGAIISKLNSDSSSTSSKRALADLSDEEVNTLLEYVNTLQGGSNIAAREPAPLGATGKGIAGLIAGLAATQGTESIIDEIKKLVREVSYDDLD
ncbi:hypothetical protein GGX14DRAFT_569511 [Mycena pura]|uniref:Uncharacterized protein n=1 Tax=Mycena pura TaxID=153505 RepID=A0AAD6YDQ6_9AGAR|nr:hypothetical protein GGX14DRAFT_569511 [Mycena pura]